jgi:hypothetical protein
MSSKLIAVTMFVSLLVGGGSAFAEAHAQNHHCKMPDGTMDMTKKHKECTAAKGTWTKDVSSDAPKAVAPAPVPTPSTTK